MRPFRKEKVESVIREIVSDAIVRKLNDPRVSTLTTVTRVKVSGDLLMATIYLTVPGDEAAERKTMRAMQHATAFLQRMVAHELSIRLCPELHFELDEGLKKVQHTLDLINQNRRNRPELFPEDDLIKPGEAQDAEAEDGEDPSEVERRSEE